VIKSKALRHFQIVEFLQSNNIDYRFDENFFFSSLVM